MTITLKSLRKSLAGAVLVGVVALAGAGTASAEVLGPVGVTVPPGGRSCIESSVAYSRVRADGSAPYAPGNTVQWSLHQDSQPIQGLTLTGNYYAAQLNSNFTNQYFPGTFKLCVRNLSTRTNLKATLTLATDAY